MSLTVLSVAYPLAFVTADPVGGAEQVLSRLDRALAAAGHRSVVVAAEGSEVAGTLLPLPPIPARIGEAETETARAAARARIAEAVERHRPDVIHLHGIDFPHYLPDRGPPVLVTLHLPLDWYPAGALLSARDGVHLHPVSRSQAQTAPPDLSLGEPIENGVDLPELRCPKRRYALSLGRICPEKGFHEALDAARAARMPLVIAGQVFPYPFHEDYFRREVEPRLGFRRRFLGPVAGRRKQELLAAAGCLLLPTRARETSSLVAMEALAAGTPVLAYPSGALPEIVEHGRTGFLVDGPEALAEAIPRAAEIDPEACRAAARARFSSEAMVARYLARYRELAG